jgi:myo-inositol-1(or 4)-monophosphatase
MKRKRDILAQADLRSEKIIINEIKKAYPSHSIISEEAGEAITNSEYVWIIDPVDGTINFSRKLNEYCVSIAVSFRNQIILAVVYNPATHELYFAEKNKGAYLNNKKIRVSRETKMIGMLLATDNSGIPGIRSKNYELLAKICNEVRHVRIFGSGALHLAKVASGKVDIYYKMKFNYWDYAAGLLLVQEAGGKVTDFNGETIKKSSKDIIASNGKIHGTILKSMAR